MAILGIENRTENWMTAQVFVPLFPQQRHAEEQPQKRDGEYARKRLAGKLLGTPGTPKLNVSLELFWYGIRDYGDRCDWKAKNYIEPCAEAYERLFPELREKVQSKFPTINARHYSASDKVKLANNLRNTEIDIVLESQHHLFIGEAKREAKFGDNASVLKHQLVRQYVMARILLDLVGKKKKIVPFVVGDDKKRLHRKKQVQFMIQCLGMRHDNVLDWDDIRQLTG